MLPLSDGYHLAYRGQAITGIELVNVFVDANTGALLQQFSEFQTEGIVGKGTGTFGDDKKSASRRRAARSSPTTDFDLPRLRPTT